MGFNKGRRKGEERNFKEVENFLIYRKLEDEETFSILTRHSRYLWDLKS